MEILFAILVGITVTAFGFAALSATVSIAEIQRKVDAFHEKLIGKEPE